MPHEARAPSTEHDPSAPATMDLPSTTSPPSDLGRILPDTLAGRAPSVSGYSSRSTALLLQVRVSVIGNSLTSALSPHECREQGIHARPPHRHQQPVESGAHPSTPVGNRHFGTAEPKSARRALTSQRAHAHLWFVDSLCPSLSDLPQRRRRAAIAAREPPHITRLSHRHSRAQPRSHRQRSVRSTPRPVRGGLRQGAANSDCARLRAGPQGWGPRQTPAEPFVIYKAQALQGGSSTGGFGMRGRVEVVRVCEVRIGPTGPPRVAVPITPSGSTVVMYSTGTGPDHEPLPPPTGTGTTGLLSRRLALGGCAGLGLPAIGDVVSVRGAFARCVSVCPLWSKTSL